MIRRLCLAMLLMLPAAAQAQQPYPTPSTSVAGTVATANTFQAVLAANSQRKGCLVVNNGTATLLVAFGNNPSATIALPVAPGGYVGCNYGNVVLTDQVSVSSTTAGAAFVVISE